MHVFMSARLLEICEYILSGAFMPGNRQVRLLLCDDVTYATLTVHIDYGAVAYIPALIPGMRVALYALNMQSSVHGRVYAHYSCQSSCRHISYDAKIYEQQRFDCSWM